MHEQEAAVLFNLCVTEYEEATSLIPSLKDHEKADLEQALQHVKEISSAPQWKKYPITHKLDIFFLIVFVYIIFYVKNENSNKISSLWRRINTTKKIRGFEEKHNKKLESLKLT